MKKITAILLGTLIASSAALAQTNQVLSRNAVGYVKKAINADQIDFVAAPFVSLSPGGNALSNVLPVAANGTQYIPWDPTIQNYIPVTRSKGAWGASGSNIVSRGSAFFVRSPAGTNQTFFFMGEVPDRFTAPTTTVDSVQGLTALASAYPIDMLWTSTPLSQALDNGDQIIVWNTVITNYVPVSKTKGSWGSATNLVLKPGQGFFVRKFGAGTTTWSQSKPYTWP